MTHQKFCINCAHCQHNIGCPTTKSYYCTYNSYIVNYDLVTGKPYYDNVKSCYDERTSKGLCGVEGKYHTFRPVTIDTVYSTTEDIKNANF